MAVERALATFGVDAVPPDEQSTTAARSAANTIAEELRSLPDQAFTTLAVEEMIMSWRSSNRREARQNVRESPDADVFSDTVGCTRDRAQRTWHIQPLTLKYRAFVKALNRWL